MYYDALTTSAVRDELNALLLGGRVQRVVQASDLAVGLEVYAGRRYPLFLSAATEAAGVWLAEAKVRRGAERVSPFYLLLAKYLRGSRLATIAQPPHERVLRIRFPIDRDFETAFEGAFRAHLEEYRVISLETVRAGILQELVLSVVLKRSTTPGALLEALRAVNDNNKVTLVIGQQSVDL